MLKIRVLGQGLIPRINSVAPRMNPFPADLTLIKTIMNTPGLKVQYIHPETRRPYDMTRENVDKVWTAKGNIPAVPTGFVEETPITPVVTTPPDICKKCGKEQCECNICVHCMKDPCECVEVCDKCKKIIEDCECKFCEKCGLDVDECTCHICILCNEDPCICTQEITTTTPSLVEPPEDAIDYTPKTEEGEDIQLPPPLPDVSLLTPVVEGFGQPKEETTTEDDEFVMKPVYSNSNKHHNKKINKPHKNKRS